MKKIIVLSLFLCLFLIGCDKNVNQEQETKTTGIKLENVSSFDSHFGMMHPEGYYQDAYDLGVRWERPHPGPFVWNDIEPKEGEYDWSHTDKWVLKVQSYDIHTAPTIWPYADWDQETCHGDEPLITPGHFHELPKRRHVPCSEEKYKKFVTALIERYDGDGENDMQGLKYPVLIYEISNEPSMQGGIAPEGGADLYFFKGTSKEYVDMLKWSYQAIKQSNSDVLVMNAGMAGFDSHHRDFWDAAMDAGADDYVDIWAFHNIGQDNDYLLTDQAEEFFNGYNIDKPFWLAENEYNYGKFDKTGDPANAAQDIVKSHVRAFAAGVDKIFFISISTEAGPPKTPSMKDRFAGDQNAIDAYTEMIAYLDYFEKAKKMEDGKYWFYMPNTSVVEVTWDENNETSVPEYNVLDVL